MRARAVVTLAVVTTVVVAVLSGVGAAVTPKQPAGGDLGAADGGPGVADGHEHLRGNQQGVGITSRATSDQTIDVQLRTNGDARWTVTVYEPLDTESDVEAFEDLGQRWEAGIADVAFDVDLFQQFVDLSSDATGRSMSIPGDSVQRVAEVHDGVGVLELTFTWTNFARQEGSRLVVNDAFLSPSGTWLPRLEQGQTLVIRPPQEYAIVDSPPGPGLDNQTVRWEGPTAFSDTYFVENPIVYRSDRPPTVTPTPTPPPTPTVTPPPPDESDLPRGLLFGIIAAILVGAALAAYRSVGGDFDLGSGTDGDDADGGDGSGAADGGDGGDDAGGGESDGEVTDGDAGRDADGWDDDALEGTDDPFAGVDEELLSDDERILRLLEANGGRMKQANIVKETDWSNAKVSQLLSSMAEDGKVDKLRIGRENLISLPDVDVADVEN